MKPPMQIDEVPQALRRWTPVASELAFPEEQGWTSTVAFVEPGEIVFKRCTDPRYCDWLRREREVLEALADSPVAVPRALDFHDSEAEVWLVMTRLPGDSCSHAIYRGDSRTREKLYAAAGEAIRQLHQAPVATGLATPRPFVEHKLEAAERNLAWCDGTPEKLESMRTRAPEPVPDRLVHADLNLDNLLVHDGKVTGFIDWAGGATGDPRIDVALALDFGAEDEPEPVLLEAFFEAYGERPEPDVLRWYRELYEFF